MGRRQEDLAGQRFGSLTVAEPTGGRRNGYVVWRCRCDCGGEALASSRHLRKGWTVDCGCGMGRGKLQDAGGAGRGRRPALKDWAGRRFGSLMVAGYDGKRGGKHYWRCLCQCGREAVVSQSNLKSGHTRSCGCLADPTSTRHFVEGTCIESIRSRKVSAGNRSGVRGVYRNRRTGRWTAQITFQGRTRYLGSFDSLEEAAAARAEAEKVFDEFLERHDAARQADSGSGVAKIRCGGAAADAAPPRRADTVQEEEAELRGMSLIGAGGGAHG